MHKRITIIGGEAGDAGLVTVQAAEALRSARSVVVDEQAEAMARAHAPADADFVVIGPNATHARRVRAVRDVLAKRDDVVRVIACGADDCEAELHALGALANLRVLVGLPRTVLETGRAWAEQLPLHGWRVLVPRTKDPLDALTAALVRDGAAPTQVSTLSVEPPRTPQQMQKAVTGLVEGRFGWVVFTSANAFAAVWQQCHEYGLDARAFAGTRIAAVGEDTREALAARGLVPDLVPATGRTTVDLLDVFPDAEVGSELVHRVFIPRADIATETLASGLVALGWEVEEVTAFRTVRSAPPAAATRDAIKNGGFDAVVFTSSASVRNLIGLAGKPNARTVVACIGPSTAKTAEEHGLRVDAMAAEPTQDALVDALVTFAEARRAAGVDAVAPAATGTVRRKAK